MKQIKLAFVILGLGVVVLVALIQLTAPSSVPVEKRAIVMANTLTQSLDGHRRYLTLKLDDEPSFRLSVPATIECPVDSIVIVNALLNQSTGQQSYKYQRCITADTTQ